LIPEDLDFPTVDDGLEGMAFITTAVQSAKAGGVWAKKICSFGRRVSRIASFQLGGRVFFLSSAVKTSPPHKHPSIGSA
jgi:hypothetical protein